MELTPRQPVNAGDASNLMCIVTQHELFGMRATIDSCVAVLHQIAAQQGQAVVKFELADGQQIVVPTQTALAMAGLQHIFGVQWNAAEVVPEEMVVTPPAEPESVPEQVPARAAWKPTLVQGGKNG